MASSDNTKEAVAVDVKVAASEAVDPAAMKAAGALLEKAFRKAEFNLATPDGSVLPRPPTLPGHKNLGADALRERKDSLKEDYGYEPEGGAWQKNTRLLVRDLVTQRERMRGVIEALDKIEVPAEEMTVSDVRDALESESTRLRALFADNMRHVLKEQRPLETNVRSLCEFFTQTGLDGNCRSVYFVNHHATPDEYSAKLEENSIYDMVADEKTEVHPLFGGVVDTATGERFPVIFRPLDDADNVKDMASMVVMGQTCARKPLLAWWAKRADEASFVSVANVSPKLVGRKPASLVGSEFAGKLAGIYNDQDKAFRSLLVTANHVVARQKSEFEDDDVLVYPSHLIAGQLYNQEYNDSRSSAFGGEAVRRDFAPDLGADSKWIDDQSRLLGDVKVAFLRTQDNYRGDGTATSFNALSMACDAGDTQLNYVMGTHFLGKVIRYHLLQHRGVDTTDAEAKRVGRLLHDRLQDLSSARDTSKYFVSARCDFNKSRVEMIKGEKTQVHDVEVQFRQGTRRFAVAVSDAKLSDDKVK
jgi:hypothetical protein